jgi:glycosyltransferase involved in cell wall biosynthesis
MQVVLDATRIFFGRRDDRPVRGIGRSGTKICPTSTVENLACGRPVLVSTAVGMSSRRKDADVFEPEVDALFDAVAALRRNYAERLRRARLGAERYSTSVTVCSTTRSSTPVFWG